MGKPVFGEDLLLPRTGRSDGDRPKPFAVVTVEFCRFELGGRGRLGRVLDGGALDGEVLGGWFLLLMLVMAGMSRTRGGEKQGLRLCTWRYYISFPISGIRWSEDTFCRPDNVE